MLQYVNPMAINTWAIAAKYPTIRQVGLCHSVQGTAEELARDLDIPVERDPLPRRRHQPHGVLPRSSSTGSPTAATATSIPTSSSGYREGRCPKPSHWNPRCPNKVRYEMLTRLGYFVTESSEHFAEYMPWFIKRDRPDLIERFGIPLDEYPKRCVEQIARWKAEAERYKDRQHDRDRGRATNTPAEIVNSVVDRRAVGDLRQRSATRGYIPRCPTAAPSRCRRWSTLTGCSRPTVRDIPPQLIALMRTNINVQELTVAALLTENPEHIYHAAMLDPHTAAELDLDQIWELIDELLAAHGHWLPEWARVPALLKSA